MLRWAKSSWQTNPAAPKEHAVHPTPPPYAPFFPPNIFLNRIVGGIVEDSRQKRKAEESKARRKALLGYASVLKGFSDISATVEKANASELLALVSAIIDNFRLSLRLHRSDRTVHALHALHALQALQACHTTKGTQRNARHHRARTSLAKFTYSRIVQHHVCTPFFEVNTSTISH